MCNCVLCRCARDQKLGIEACRKCLHSSLAYPPRHLVIHYARFILCVLHILLYGEWGAIILLGSSSPDASSALQNSVSDWITSPSFNECAGSAIKAMKATEVVSEERLGALAHAIPLWHISLPRLLDASTLRRSHVICPRRA